MLKTKRQQLHTLYISLSLPLRHPRDAHWHHKCSLSTSLPLFLPPPLATENTCKTSSTQQNIDAKMNDSATLNGNMKENCKYEETKKQEEEETDDATRHATRTQETFKKNTEIEHLRGANAKKKKRRRKELRKNRTEQNRT